jgi:hypothetical protein
VIRDAQYVNRIAPEAMPTLSPRRLAGFRFVAQPPALPEKLPRMDIAVFVGFASAGPLDYPVVIEDPAQFRDIFGDDVPLAWDSRRSEAVHAHLAPTVRAFFRNGGRRCWVIRVAGEKAETDEFPIPGLAQVDDAAISPAFLRGRSPGGWFDAFDCATALSVRSVEMASAPATGFATLNAYLSTSDELSAGDLLRLRWLEPALEDVQLYFEVSQVELLPESPPASGRRWFGVQGRPVAWIQAVSAAELLTGTCTVVWRRLPARENRAAEDISVAGWLVSAETSPLQTGTGHQLNIEAPEDFTPPAGTLLQVDLGAERLWFVVDEVRLHDDDKKSPPSGHVELFGRGFRHLSNAPSAALNLVPIADQLSFELKVRRGDRYALWLTGLGFAPTHPRYLGALPSDTAMFEFAQFSDSIREAEAEEYEELWREAREPRFPLAGDGCASAVLIPLGMGALAEPFLLPQYSEADALTRDGLDDFHAGLFLDPDLQGVGTTALMGEADFLRYQSLQTRRLRGIHAALEVEEATLIVVPDAVQRGWKLVDPVSGPEPQSSPPLPHPSWGLSDDCSELASPPVGLVPRWDKFLECGLRVLAVPRLEVSQPPDTLGSFTLSWASGDADVTFVLEEAVEPDFRDAAVIYQGAERRRRIFGRGLGQYYYRVRAVAGTETSNWSNGETVWVRPTSLWQLATEDEFDTGAVLDVHRALLRLCAACGDLLAVLALPEHFHEEEALAYLDVLRHNAAEEEVPEDQLTLPLGTGEESAFSFGAVYHPWIFGREPGSGLRRSPPDGAAAGVLARRSIERGAWIAPANELWRGAVGLSPVLNPDRRLELLLARINQVRQEPAGFMTLNADTLSADPDLRPINVRRLLILLRRMALRLGMTYVFEPNGPAFRRRVQRGFESLLDQLFVRGAFAGATRAQSFQVVTDDSLNTPQTAEQGRFRVDLKVAPSLPMSFVTVRLVQLGERGFTSEIV